MTSRNNRTIDSDESDFEDDREPQGRDHPLVDDDERSRAFVGEMEPSSDWIWIALMRMGVASIVGAIPVLIFSLITAQYILVYTFIAIFFVSGFGLVVTCGLKFLVLLFFFLAYTLAALIWTLLLIMESMNDVYVCRSARCQGSNYPIFMVNYLLVCCFAGIFYLTINGSLSILVNYRSI